jgi:hypothetical protein
MEPGRSLNKAAIQAFNTAVEADAQVMADQLDAEVREAELHDERMQRHRELFIPRVVSTWCRRMGVNQEDVQYDIESSEYFDIPGQGTVNDYSPGETYWESTITWRLEDHTFRAVARDRWTVVDDYNREHILSLLDQYLDSPTVNEPSTYPPGFLDTISVNVEVVPEVNPAEPKFMPANTLAALGYAFSQEFTSDLS